MAQYEVTITFHYRETYRVEAESEEGAKERVWWGNAVYVWRHDEADNMQLSVVKRGTKKARAAAHARRLEYREHQERTRKLLEEE